MRDKRICSGSGKKSHYIMNACVFFSIALVLFLVLSTSVVDAKQGSGKHGSRSSSQNRNPAGSTIQGSQSSSQNPNPAGPTIGGIKPHEGQSGGGTMVTIVTKNVIEVEEVDFGSTPAAYFTIVDNTINAISPGGYGTLKITVILPSGESLQSPDKYSYKITRDETRPKGFSSANQSTNMIENATGSSYQIYSNPTYQINMSYPSDWQEQDVDPSSCWAPRDYGDNTCNIVNFFSPSASDGSYRVFSIDVGNPSLLPLQTYFNQVTFALENNYPGFQIAKNTVQQSISSNLAYELEFHKGFQENSPIGIEILTFDRNNVPYVISYNSFEDQEFYNMIHSIQITSGTT